MSALRTRGRGDNKKPDRYEWDIGWGSACLNHRDLFFALVDLKWFQELPDAFIVPSRVICRYFKGGTPETWPRARYHVPVADLEPYRNQWRLIKKALGRSR